MIQHISSYYSALPNLYDFDGMEPEEFLPGVKRVYIYGSQSQIVKLIIKKGAEVPLHHHVNEQITGIMKGKVRVMSQNKEFIVSTGEVLILPPNVPHEFIALEDAINIDFFTPARQDWLEAKNVYNE
jgi:quercetin dioxygenase-like cupin family protein